MNEAELVHKFMTVDEILDEKGYSVGVTSNGFFINKKETGRTVSRLDTVDGVFGFLEGIRENE